MNDPVSVQVLERLSDLENDLASHLGRHGLKLACREVLLQISTRHVLHDNAVHVFASELLFESDDVWAIFAPRLKINLSADLPLMSLV